VSACCLYCLTAYFNTSPLLLITYDFMTQLMATCLRLVQKSNQC
jgi:hypothetical protein